MNLKDKIKLITPRFENQTLGVVFLLALAKRHEYLKRFGLQLEPRLNIEALKDRHQLFTQLSYPWAHVVICRHVDFISDEYIIKAFADVNKKAGVNVGLMFDEIRSIKRIMTKCREVALASGIEFIGEEQNGKA